MENETTYSPTSKWHAKNIIMHLGFKYNTDQARCAILEKLSNPSVLTFVLGAQKNRLQGDGSVEHPWHFAIRK